MFPEVKRIIYSLNNCRCQFSPQARFIRSAVFPLIRRINPKKKKKAMRDYAHEFKECLINILPCSPSLPLREVAQIDQFLQETAAREANAKVRLQQFIEELLDRADRAEKQLQIISSCGTTPNGSLGRCSLQASKGNGRQVRIS